MTILAHIDADGRALGFYDLDIHGAAIPPDALAISDAVHAAWIKDTAGQRWDGAALVACEPPAQPKATAGQQRRRRNALLSACDWTQMADAPLTAAEKKAWIAYRKALRDVTQQPDFPASVTWPEEPAA